MRRFGRWWCTGSVLVVLIFLRPVGTTRAESPEEIFERGNAAYDAGRFDEAAEAYRTLIRYQIEDPRLEYNLGNAEFRLGNLGRAIVHYERAKRLDPTDPDIRANLEFAQERRLDRVPPTEQPVVVAWLVGLQNRLGPDRQAWAVVALVWALSALLAWGLAERGRWSGKLGWLTATLVLAVALCGLSWYTTYQRLEGKPTAVVVEDLAAVLAGPGQNNAKLATIHEGLDVEVWGERNEWVQVRLPNGVSGWIERRMLEFV